jgi:hypothetical protein
MARVCDAARCGNPEWAVLSIGGVAVHRFTENVVKPAKVAEAGASVEQLQERAAIALEAYFLLATDWVPNPALTSEAERRNWHQTTRKTMRGVVQRAWDVSKKREQIFSSPSWGANWD